MGIVFGWLPMPTGLDQESWLRFLDIFSAVFVVLLLATFAIAVLGYRSSAGRRRIVSHTDVFRPYTPLNWLWASLGGALVTVIACAVTYKNTTDGYLGMFSVCCEFFLLMLVLAFLSSYLMMAFGSVTPRKYKYRAIGFLHGSKIKPSR